MIDSEGLSEKTHLYIREDFFIKILRSKIVLSQKFFQMNKDPPELDTDQSYAIDDPLCASCNEICMETYLQESEFILFQNFI